MIISTPGSKISTLVIIKHSRCGESGNSPDSETCRYIKNYSTSNAEYWLEVFVR